jgi:hypothetical protein
MKDYLMVKTKNPKKIIFVAKKEKTNTRYL